MSQHPGLCQTCSAMPLAHVSITGASIPVLAAVLGYDFARHQRVGPRYAAVMVSAPTWFFEVHCPDCDAGRQLAQRR